MGGQAERIAAGTNRTCQINDALLPIDVADPNRVAKPTLSGNHEHLGLGRVGPAMGKDVLFKLKRDGWPTVAGNHLFDKRPATVQRIAVIIIGPPGTGHALAVVKQLTKPQPVLAHLGQGSLQNLSLVGLPIVHNPAAGKDRCFAGKCGIRHRAPQRARVAAAQSQRLREAIRATPHEDVDGLIKLSAVLVFELPNGIPGARQRSERSVGARGDGRFELSGPFVLAVGSDVKNVLDVIAGHSRFNNPYRR